ncbi:MAG TPA: T9SS type A sorting domain-containing protein [Aequorivita sp.]|nr:T9SS type A sorting domain-containing protein [Aequorivita sp.]
MKIKLLFLSTLFCSFSIKAQIDFSPHIIVDSHPEVSGPYTLVAADIDGDGDLDLVATSTNGGKVVWFENLDGKGNFSDPKIINSDLEYPMDIAVADIDNDGHLDVIAVSTFDNKIAWFKNTDGFGNFGPINLVPTTLEYIQTVQAADMDGDGDIDIIAGGNYKVVWLENMDGLGTFGSEKIVSNNTETTESIVVSDIDGDGDMDVIVADDGRAVVSWYENIDGLGTFGPERIIDNTNGTLTVITTDINNDGNLDVVSVSDETYIAWFENIDGNGNFSSPKIIYAEQGFAFKLFAADLDGDGNVDILASLFLTGEIIWIKNNGDGSFSSPELIYTKSAPIPVIADDFNGDGKIDVAVGIYGANQIIWFENKGPLSIEENTTNLFSIYPNPANNLLNIKSKTPISQITIHNNIGQLLLSSTKENQVDISALSEGIYFVKISDENGLTEIKNIVKN